MLSFLVKNVTIFKKIFHQCIVIVKIYLHFYYLFQLKIVFFTLKNFHYLSFNQEKKQY